MGKAITSSYPFSCSGSREEYSLPLKDGSTFCRSSRLPSFSHSLSFPSWKVMSQTLCTFWVQAKVNEETALEDRISSSYFWSEVWTLPQVTGRSVMIFTTSESSHISHTSTRSHRISLTAPSIKKKKQIQWQPICARMTRTSVVARRMHQSEQLQEHKWPTAQPRPSGSVTLTWGHAPCGLFSARLSPVTPPCRSSLVWDTASQGEGTRGLTISLADPDLGLHHSPELLLPKSPPSPLSSHICQTCSMVWRCCLTLLEASLNKSLGHQILFWHLLLSGHKLT